MEVFSKGVMSNKIKSFGIDFCIITTVVLISFLILNVLSYAVIQVRKAYVSDLPMVIIYGDTLEKAVNGAYPGLSFNDILRIYEDTKRLDLELENFTMFAERKGYSSATVNISKNGYRLSEKQQPINTDRKKVFIFGSSPTFGYNLRDRDTVASHLQNVSGDELAVFNFGRGYYYSRQQFSLLINLVVDQNIKPDYVVFINNHANEPGLLGPATKQGFEKIAANARGGASVRELFPVVKILQYIGREYLKPKVPIGDQVTATAQQDIDYFMRTNKAVKEFCDANGIQFVSVYAPAFGYKYANVERDPLNRPDAKYDERSLGIFKTIDDWFAAGKMPPYFYNLLNLNDTVERPYIDTAHFSPSLSKVIAKNIYDIIVSKEKRGTPHDPRTP